MNRRDFIKSTAAAGAAITIAPAVLTELKQNFDGRRFDIPGHTFRVNDVIVVSDGETQTYLVTTSKPDYFIALPVSGEVKPGYYEPEQMTMIYRKWDILDEK